ncbi:TonB-dependent receptor [Wenzhouxiangella sp. XN24]|uniref:TonB-dependent receptor domain-containing protein n=1 Tax=Wenzhouxiangella sp. XN24 TaxID=2713569 RepID=UPI0013EBA9EB|nr:TonB-dependent receptor [Wenzhouxiangella sp. XN24]NGX16357.1 TonB-dependent receptor [Wenzhouxiangella sp. XN24]
MLNPPASAVRRRGPRLAMTVQTALVLALSSPAAGQAETGAAVSAPGDASVAGSPSAVLNLGAIVVSATRTEREQFTTPAAVSVLTRESIQDTQPYGFQDVFEMIPGVNVQGGPRRIAEEPAIRGFADEQVIIRLDGTRQNFNKAHGGRFLVDPDLIRSIEVLRGASSAVYGSGALGGVFVIETVNGRDMTGDRNGFGTRLKASHQSNGDEWGGSAIAYGQAGAFDILGSYVVRDVREDLEDGGGDPIAATQDEIGEGLFKFGFEPGRHQRVELTIDRFENQGINPTNANAVATPTNVVDRSTERDSARFRYRYDDPGNRWLHLDFSAYRNNVDTDEFRLDDGRVDRTNFETRGLEVTNSSRFGGGIDGMRLTYGIELYGDEQSGTREGADRPQFPDADVDYRAGFIQAEIPFGERISMIPGVRYDEFEYAPAGAFPSRDEDSVSPRLAIGWSPTDDLYLWTEYAEAFRAPSLTELYADGVHFVAPFGPGQIVINEFVPTPGLLPEESSQFQAGLRWRRASLFGSDLDMELDLTAWTSDVKNFVDQTVIFISGPPAFNPITQTLEFPGITTNSNVDAELKGFEATVRLQGRVGWVQAALTAIEGEGADGEDLGSVQPDRVALAAGVHLLSDQLSVGGELIASSDRRDVPEGALATPGYGKTDVFLNWLPDRGLLSGFELRLALDNVFDKDYRIHPNGIDQPGRSIRLTIAKDLQWLD